MKNSVITRCQECRIKSTAVSALNNAELDFLNRNCTPGIFKKGKSLLKEGEPGRFIVYIRDGFVKQFKKLAGDKEHIVNIVKKGSYIGLHNIVPGTGINYVSAVALNDTTACFINKECFDELLRNNGEFASRVLSYICENEMFFLNRLLKNQHQQLYGRLADALLYFRYVVYNENPFELDMTRTEIASFTGVSRETVSRALKEFENNGIILINKKRINILKEDKLQLLKKSG